MLKGTRAFCQAFFWEPPANRKDALRKTELYSAGSTRVLCGKYYGGFRMPDGVFAQGRSRLAASSFYHWRAEGETGVLCFMMLFVCRKRKKCGYALWIGLYLMRYGVCKLSFFYPHSYVSLIHTSCEIWWCRMLYFFVVLQILHNGCLLCCNEVEKAMPQVRPKRPLGRNRSFKSIDGNKNVEDKRLVVVTWLVSCLSLWLQYMGLL